MRLPAAYHFAHGLATGAVAPCQLPAHPSNQPRQLTGWALWLAFLITPIIQTAYQVNSRTHGLGLVVGLLQRLGAGQQLRQVDGAGHLAAKGHKWQTQRKGQRWQTAGALVGGVAIKEALCGPTLTCPPKQPMLEEAAGTAKFAAALLVRCDGRGPHPPGRAHADPTPTHADPCQNLCRPASGQGRPDASGQGRPVSFHHNGKSEFATLTWCTRARPRGSPGAGRQ